MVHHLVLCKLKPDVSERQVEEMMRRTRMSLLKIDVALAVQCGRNVDPESEWEFFVAIDVGSLEKLSAYKENAIYIKYMEEILRPNTAERLVLDYELDPNRFSMLA